MTLFQLFDQKSSAPKSHWTTLQMTQTTFKHFLRQTSIFCYLLTKNVHKDDKKKQRIYYEFVIGWRFRIFLLTRTCQVVIKWFVLHLEMLINSQTCEKVLNLTNVKAFTLFRSQVERIYCEIFESFLEILLLDLLERWLNQNKVNRLVFKANLSFRWG